MKVGLATFLRDPQTRGYRIKLQQTLMLVALLVFGVSLVLPAASIAFEGTEERFFLPGLNCLMVSKLHYFSNLLLFAAPLNCLMMRRCRRGWGPGVVSVITLISFGMVAATPWLELPSVPTSREMIVTFELGFYIWLAAHLIMTFALTTPVWGEPDDEAMLHEDFRYLQARWMKPVF